MKEDKDRLKLTEKTEEDTRGHQKTQKDAERERKTEEEDGKR